MATNSLAIMSVTKGHAVDTARTEDKVNDANRMDQEMGSLYFINFFKKGNYLVHNSSDLNLIVQKPRLRITKQRKTFIKRV